MHINRKIINKIKYRDELDINIKKNNTDFYEIFYKSKKIFPSGNEYCKHWILALHYKEKIIRIIFNNSLNI